MSDHYSDEGMELDPRLTPYRDRAAEVHRGGARVGRIFVESAVWREFAGGPPWRRRWGPAFEIARVFVRLDGRWHDDYADPDAIEGYVAAWAQDRYAWGGEVLHLAWLSDLDSRLAEERQIADAELSRGQATEIIDLLWRRHRSSAIVPRLRLEPVGEVDLAGLEAELTRCMKEWRDLGRLVPSELAFLARYVSQIDAALPELDALERLYHRRGQRIAMRVLASHAA